MKCLLLGMFFLSLTGAARAYPYDARLDMVLAGDFKKIICASSGGRELYSRLARSGPENSRRRLFLRSDKGPWLAYFSRQDNAIYFNSRFIMRFFGVKNRKDTEVIEILLKNSKARAELVKRADSVYLHELVHALQTYLYPDYGGSAAAIPLEFEYEAYFTEDLYTHEKMKRSPKLLKAFISGAYYDLYTENALGGYLKLSLDPAAYRERIRKKYEDEVGGYLSFEQAETYKQNSVQDAKILSYASGRAGDYIGETAALERLRLEKNAYDRYLEDFYLKRWPVFSSAALLFAGTAALEVKNYPLALDCLAMADENAVKYGVPRAELLSLKSKGALAILEAADFTRDHAKKMSLDILSQHLKALEKACRKTARPFPPGLSALRDKTYPAAAGWYAKKAGLEKDSDKFEYYKENADYFSTAEVKISSAGAGELFP
ncbi:MAG: hypothetical protein A2X34_01430 [Elusimicrobia bacterium GWC2_51_8]|nr:MAG: hypothetical protein A2X33_08545 [Elusimicrobia bacterium GWA2_51_34]OGR57656.1 MAG: hypothetical protein A2X34_01430 [Elusimicrobia bacterium GWC2_51_8]OGR88298.1 MAG: hypothetical protein A2021_06175 [Elusimicrobia bacterium GWF2_52_66]HCE98036.1 hypothetical protein [Elusimicrobiota bacterium]